MNKYLIVSIVLVVVIFILYRLNKNTVTYTLPLNPDPLVFGPYYWKALHSVSNRIPCEICKTDAVNFMSFFHDHINRKLGKPFYDQTNYNNVLNQIKAI